MSTMAHALHFALRDNDLVQQSIETEVICQETSFELCYLPPDPRLNRLSKDTCLVCKQLFHNDLDAMIHAAHRLDFYTKAPSWVREVLAADRRHWTAPDNSWEHPTERLPIAAA